MAMSCDTGQQPTDWCPSTAAEALPSVLGLLPSGPAWDGAAVPGTQMNMFWTSVAAVAAFVYERFCAYLPEFHCDTIVESTDQWLAEYGLPDACDPFGNNLCTKATIVGGQDFATFEAIARDAGWVIACENIPTTNFAGVTQVGCTMLSAMPDMIGNGSNLNYGVGLACEYGQVTEHPEPQYWEHDSTWKATCEVPGSNLGQASGAPDCCYIVGYYEPKADVAAPASSTPCAIGDPSISFACPVSKRPSAVIDPCDSTGKWPIAFGNLFAWKVTVDLKASSILQGSSIPAPAPGTNNCVGAAHVGCAPLCANSPPAEFVLCFLDSIKPAHTILVTSVTQ